MNVVKLFWYILIWSNPFALESKMKKACINKFADKKLKKNP